MPLKVLIVPDKFKGTLTAGAAAQAIATGWRKARGGDSLKLLPMSDGGDGFGEIIGGLIGGKVQFTKTVDAAHRPHRARWWWHAPSKTAIIESATVIGLAMLPPGRFHPFELDTFGLAALMRAATAKGARRCVIGIGGSATNDGGFGLARGFGWEFVNASGKNLDRWTDLSRLAHIRRPRRFRWFDETLVAVDVGNLLLGQRGATRVYGPQKGIRPEDVKPAEACLRRLARVMKKEFGCDFSRQPGAGAAGGLGFGLMTFLGARPTPGFDLFARYAALDQKLKSIDLVLTGEGAIDDSTLMGKGVGQLATRCRELKVPCVGLAGMLSQSAKVKCAFVRAYGLTDLTSVEQAKARPEFWLKKLAAHAASETTDPLPLP
ncbi:MAG: glycerate kinase [Verrucomicrobiae bacterium]